MQLPVKQINTTSISFNKEPNRLGSAARRELCRLLPDLYDPVTRAWLLQHLKSVEKGQGLHVGCGTGEDTFLLANLPGREFQLCGLDQDPVLIEQAQQAKSLKKQNNVSFIQSRLAEWKSVRPYDFIFIRHMTPVSPEWQLLTQHLKTGGELFAQVIDFTGFHSFPYNHAFARSTEILKSLSDRSTQASGLREYLLKSLDQAGLEPIELTNALPAFVHPDFHSILSLFLEWTREEILLGQHATRAELNALMLELQQYETQEDTLISRPGIYLIRARKSRD